MSQSVPPLFKVLHDKAFEQVTFPESIVIPDTFNEVINVVIFFNIVRPDTYNELLIVVASFNIVKPDTNNDDVHVVLSNVVNPDIFNDYTHVILFVAFVNIAPLNTAGNLIVPSVDVLSNRPAGFNTKTGSVVFCVDFALSPMSKTRELSLFLPNKRATPSVDV